VYLLQWRLWLHADSHEKLKQASGSAKAAPFDEAPRRVMTVGTAGGVE
jgi:hypothetical protein